MRFRHILFIALLMVTAALQANNFSIKTVVIDAGHGGKDPGAIGNAKTFEKDVALAVALKLGSYIQENFPDVRVVYTRKTDVFLELHERAEIANKAKADLFIAIHCNSSTNEAVYGSSSYVLGLHKTEANLEVAKRENSVILLEDDREKHYEFNPNTPEGHIIMSMKQNAFLDQSIHFASKIENHMENSANRKSLGVKQAGFYVLYKTAMPSLLAEIGFISNPDEERFLNSEKGQDQIALALLNSFRDYKNEIEGSNDTTDESEQAQKLKPAEKSQPTSKTEVKSLNKPETKTEVKAETGTVQPVKTPSPEVIKPKVELSEAKSAEPKKEAVKVAVEVRKPIENASGGGKVAVAKPADKPATETKIEKPVEVKIDKPVAETKVVKTETEVKGEVKPVTENKEVSKPLVAESKIEAVPVFKIQLFVLREELKEKEKLTKLFNEVSSEPLNNGLTRYYGGNSKSYSEIKKLLQVAYGNGYKDAYIVGFKDGKRLNYEELKAFESR